MGKRLTKALSDSILDQEKVRSLRKILHKNTLQRNYTLGKRERKSEKEAVLLTSFRHNQQKSKTTMSN